MIVDMTKINGVPLEAYIHPRQRFIFSLPKDAIGVWINGVYNPLQPQRPKYRGFIKTVGRTMRKD